jgi:hypothetical protein
MSFKHKSTVIYQVWGLDVWGNEEDGWQVNDRWRMGAVSVRTDRQSKSGTWSPSNRVIVTALGRGDYLDPEEPSLLDIDGDDDGILFVDDATTGKPVLQLEYERHHHINEPSKGLFGSETQENPTGTGLSTLQIAGLAAVGIAVVGGIGYWLYQQSQSATATPLPSFPTPSPSANLPVVQTMAQIGQQLPAAGPSGTVPTGGEPGQWVQPPPNPAAYPPAWLDQSGASPGVDEPQTGYSYPGG